MLSGLHYEPLPPTVVYQRTTREGQFILYFVPAQQPSDDSAVPGDPISEISADPLPRQDAGVAVNQPWSGGRGA
jgi:hypothetical protein